MHPDPLALNYRGGLAGACVPLVIFLAGVAWLGLAGAAGERGFWPILVAALAAGLLLCRDRHAYSEAVIEGMSQPIITVMILAWLLAGTLAALMDAGGFVEALVWVAQSLGLHGAGFVLATFIVACAVSTSTGTSLGTVMLCSPLLYPAGGALDAPPALLLGAILGGATFGDNISPVSDTTIASTVTQGARMGEVVRTRLSYALPAAALAATFYFVGGLLAEPPETPSAAAAPTPAVSVPDSSESAPDGAAPARSAGASPRGLPMLLAPVLVIFLLFRHVHLLEGLIFGLLAAVVLGLAFGLLGPTELIFVDPQALRVGGVLVDGIERGVGVSIFTMLLMGLVAGLEASGVIRRLLAFASRHITSPRSAEWWSFGAVSAATLLTTHSVVALLAVGPFARETGFRQGIPASRRANILDTTVCTYPFLLPYCIPTILAASTTATGPSFGMPTLTATTAGLYNFHSWALLLVVLVAIATGWGRHPTETAPPLGTEPVSPWERQHRPLSSTGNFFTSLTLSGHRPAVTAHRRLSQQDTEKVPSDVVADPDLRRRDTPSSARQTTERIDVAAESERPDPPARTL